jgi:hypothetical protein
MILCRQRAAAEAAAGERAAATAAAAWQDFDLERDSTCDLKDSDFPGRIWVPPPPLTSRSANAGSIPLSEVKSA